MVDFSMPEEIMYRLDAVEPAERRREVAVALASRAALRVLPLLSKASDGKPREISRLSWLALRVFRAAAVACAAAEYPARATELTAAARASTNFAAALITIPAVNVACAAANSASILDATIVANAASVAVNAARGAVTGEGRAAALDAALDSDVVAIGSRSSGAELVGLSLWPTDSPSWAVESWLALKGALLQANQGWAVWTDWYEARLAGNADDLSNEALEVARATISDEIWKQGPAAVNAEIKRLIGLHAPKLPVVASFAVGIETLASGGRGVPSVGATLQDAEARASIGEVAASAEPPPAGRTYTDDGSLIHPPAQTRWRTAAAADADFATQPPSSVPQVLTAGTAPQSLGETIPPPEFAPILAARSALRVLPLLATDRARTGDQDKSRFALAIFRALATAWARVRYPSDVSRQACLAAARDVRAYAPGSGEAALHVAQAAEGAAYCGGSKGGTVAVTHSRNAQLQAYDALRAAIGDPSTEVILRLGEQSDAHDIVPGVRPTQFAEIELWPGREQPHFLLQPWIELKEALQFAPEGWEVWIDWYEARLDGRVRDQKVELAYVRFVENVPSAAAAYQANAEIKRLIDAAVPHFDASPSRDLRPGVPAAKPAAIEPIVRRGRLTLPKAAAEADMKGATIPAALKALKRSLNELAEIAADEQNNIDKRFAARLDEIAKSVPIKRPNQVELFRLGHCCDELGEYRNTVASTWPEHLAPRYLAATLAFERTLRRFPKWVDFTREPPIAKLSGQAPHQVAQAAQAVSAVMREAEDLAIVDPVLPEALDRFSQSLDRVAARDEAWREPIELGTDLLAQDVLESVNNVLKIIAEQAMAAKAKIGQGADFTAEKLGSYGKEFGKRADRSMRKSAGQLGDKVGPAFIKLAKWTFRVSIGVGVVHSQGPMLAAWLIQNYPQMFSWLEPVMMFLH